MSRATIDVDPDILFYAFRYALGRSTYAVGHVVNWLHEHWDSFDKHTQIQIIKEIHEAIEEGRAGMEQDVNNWKTITQLEVSPR